MIQITTKAVLNLFLRHLELNPNNFREVFLVSPFLDFYDEKFQCRWETLLLKLESAKVIVNLITRRHGSENHKENIKKFSEIVTKSNPLYIEKLHAKIYLAVGKKKKCSIGLFSSANLTNAALISSLEASLFITPPFNSTDRNIIDRLYRLCIQIKGLIIKKKSNKRIKQENKK